MLESRLELSVQKDMMSEVVRLVRRATRWLLRNRPSYDQLTETITLFSKQTETLYDALPKLMVGEEAKYCEERKANLINANVPAELASKMALIRSMYSALNIIETAAEHQVNIYDVATAYFNLADRLDLVWFREQINSFEIANHWTLLARAAYKGDLDLLQRQLTLAVLRHKRKKENIHDCIQHWLENQSRFLQRWQALLADLRSSSNKDFAMLTVAMRELSELSEAK